MISTTQYKRVMKINGEEASNSGAYEKLGFLLRFKIIGS